MLRETHKQKSCGVKTINTDAKYRGGVMRSSEETFVMEAERRHGIVQSGILSQLQIGGA
jgi:hypothetical protein